MRLILCFLLIFSVTGDLTDLAVSSAKSFEQEQTHCTQLAKHIEVPVSEKDCSNEGHDCEGHCLCHMGHFHTVTLILENNNIGPSLLIGHDNYPFYLIRKKKNYLVKLIKPPIFS